MLTAKGFELSRDDLRDNYGIVDVLLKPFSPRQLVKQVEQIANETVDTSPGLSGVEA
jgi:DNA-binding response OmpR family regulator